MFSIRPISKYRNPVNKSTSNYWAIGTSYYIILVLLLISILSQRIYSKKLPNRFKSRCARFVEKKMKEQQEQNFDYLRFNINSSPRREHIRHESSNVIMRSSAVGYYHFKTGKNAEVGPALIARWYKYNELISPNNKRYKLKGCSKKPPLMNTKLIIRNAVFGDSGMYRCVLLRFDSGNHVVTLNYTVYIVNNFNISPPIFDANETLPALTENQLSNSTLNSTILHCPYKKCGNSTIVITWFWNGEIFRTNQTVIEVCYSGNYTCEVKNHVGSFTRNFEIHHSGLHCRSTKLTILLAIGVILLFFIAILISLLKLCIQFLKKTFNNNKHYLKDITNWPGYGMYTFDNEANDLKIDESKEDDDEEVTPLPFTVDKIDSQSNLEKQLEENSHVLKEDLELVKKKEIPRDRISCVNKDGKPLELGRGFFGSVYKGFFTTNIGNKIPVAIKMLKDSSLGIDYGHFIEEAATLIRSDGHENVISLVGTCIMDSLTAEDKAVENPKYPILIMELADGGNLLSYLQQCRKYNDMPGTSKESPCNGSVNFIELVAFCHQIGLGMMHLNEKKILHRDLAARNILLTKNKVAKIGDFGLSKHLFVKSYYRICSRWEKPVKWTSPEALMRDRYTVWSDIWSFGVLMWEVFSLGEDPYSGIDVRDLYFHLQKGNRLPCPAMATEALYQCMRSCWAWKPENRKTFSKLTQEISEVLNAPMVTVVGKNLLDCYCDPQQLLKKTNVQMRSRVPSITLINQFSSGDSSNNSSIVNDIRTAIVGKSAAIVAKSTTKDDNLKKRDQISECQNLPELDNSKQVRRNSFDSQDVHAAHSSVHRHEDTPYVTEIPTNIVTNSNGKKKLFHNNNLDVAKSLISARNCVIFENQSYQHRMRNSSLGSPVESESSSPVESKYEVGFIDFYKQHNFNGISFFMERV